MWRRHLAGCREGVSPSPGWSCKLAVAAETAALLSRSSHHGIVHLAIQFDGIGVQFPDVPQRKFSFLIRPVACSALATDRPRWLRIQRKIFHACECGRTSWILDSLCFLTNASYEMFSGIF